MASRPLDSQRIREIARDVELFLRNYDRIDSEESYQKFFQGIVAWRKANLERGGYRDLMHYLRDNVQYTAKDVDRQMEVFRKKAKPLFDLEQAITPRSIDFKGWLEFGRRFWKPEVLAALAGLPEVGVWLDKLRRDKKRDLKPDFAVTSERNVSIDGFHMLFHDYDEEDPEHRTFNAILHEGLKLYQRNATRYLPQLLRKKLPMEIRFGVGHASGNYGGGLIALYKEELKSPERVAKVVAHETGHYIGLDWMSQPARAFWIAAIKQDMAPIRLSEMLARWPVSKPYFMDWLIDAKYNDPVTWMQLDAILNGFVKMPEKFVKADDWSREGLARYIQTEGDQEIRMMRTPITPYANQNPDEAFAEAIALLVAYGPQAVHQRVREWLDIVLPGEIKVAAVDGVIALKTLTRFAATIDHASVARWKKDLRVMTKIYKDLGDDEDPEKWAEARRIFAAFRVNFEEWVYQRLLPKETSDRPRSPLENSIAKLAWDLRFHLDGSTLFPIFHATKAPDWLKFRSERDRNLKRYQAAANKLFKEIDLYLDTKPGSEVDRRDPIEHFEVSGIGVIVKNTGRSGTDEDDLELFLRSLKRHANKIGGAGFAKAVRGLTVTVDFDVQKSEWDTAGKYNPESDTLTMYPMGLVRVSSGHGTFTHECGHRFYFKELSPTARQRWHTVMTERGVQIGQDDIDRYVGLVKAAIDPMRPNGADLRRVILPQAKDESEAAKFRELVHIPAGPLLGGPFEESRFREILSSQLGEYAQIEEITEYANTNPMEAFAEVFRLWIDKGPQALGPWTREFFIKTCAGGGVRLANASQVAAQRYTPAENVAINMLVQDPDATVDELLRKLREFDMDLYDEVTGKEVNPVDVVRALERYAPKPIHGNLKVYHATDRATANALLRRGLIPETKPRPRGEEFEYAPGRGIDVGMYVGLTPRDVNSYGRVILEVVVPKEFLEVPTELAQLGETDPLLALRRHDGAIINRRLPPEAFRILPDDKLAALKVAARYDVAELSPFDDVSPAYKVAARYKEKKQVPKANGRGMSTVYVYSERQISKRNKEKAKRLQAFKPKVEKLRAKVKEDLKSEDEKTRLTALVVALIDETHERVGSPASAKGDLNDDGEPHFGVSQWRKKHVSLGDSKATIKYVGKSGVDQEKEVTTPYVLSALRDAVKAAEGKESKLFEGVTGEKVNAYLEEFFVSAKDLRGLATNGAMQKALKRIRAKGGKLPEDKKEREKKLKAEFKQALEEVAEQIGGHEPSTLANQYLAPNMRTEYEATGKIIDRLDS